MKTMNFLLISLLTNQAFAAPLPISPQEVAGLILKQSYRAQEINLQAEQSRYDWALANSVFDFDLTATYGQQTSRFENASMTYFEEDKSTLATLSLAKPFITGTTFSVEISSTHSSPRFANGAPIAATESSTSVLGFTLEQDLLQNFFGQSDRATLRAAKATYEATRIERLGQLQSLVLEGVRAYWTAFVAHEAYQNAVASRDRYFKLVDSVKKKSGYGYTGPGELSQAQAELESREQRVRSEFVASQAATEQLITLLKLPPGTEIQFAALKDLPPPPPSANSNFEIDKLRTVKSSELTLKAAEESLSAANSEALVDLSLVGKYYAQGLDENSNVSTNEATAFKFPKYYVGLQLEYNFGSGIQEETVTNRRLKRDLARTQLERKRLELNDEAKDIQRRIQSTYFIAQSSKAQIALREKAAQELTRSHAQGRTDISILIEALNKYFESEVQWIRASGDYQIALTEWASFQDDLIREDKANVLD